MRRDAVSFLCQCVNITTCLGHPWTNYMVKLCSIECNRATPPHPDPGILSQHLWALSAQGPLVFPATERKCSRTPFDWAPPQAEEESHSRQQLWRAEKSSDLHPDFLQTSDLLGEIGGTIWWIVMIVMNCDNMWQPTESHVGLARTSSKSKSMLKASFLPQKKRWGSFFEGEKNCADFAKVRCEE